MVGAFSGLSSPSPIPNPNCPRASRASETVSGVRRTESGAAMEAVKQEIAAKANRKDR